MPDPWENLTDHETAALERAEEKYKQLGPQASPFPDTEPLATAHILRVNFASFHAADGIHIHADRNRLKPLCEMGQRVWLPELEHLLGLLVKAETELQAHRTLDDDLEWELQSYGVKLSLDSAISGYGENSSPLVLNRKMFFEFLQFLGRTLRASGKVSDSLAASELQLTELLVPPARP